jgi:hypothetical protein
MSDQPNQNIIASSQQSEQTAVAPKNSELAEAKNAEALTGDATPEGDDFNYVYPAPVKLAFKIGAAVCALSFIFYLSAIFFAPKQHFDKARAIDFVQRTERVLIKYHRGSISVKALDTLRLDMTHQLGGSYSSVGLGRFYQSDDKNFDSVIINVDTGEVRKLLLAVGELPDTSIRGYYKTVAFDKKYIGDEAFDRYNLYQFVTPPNNFLNDAEEPAFDVLVTAFGALTLVVIFTIYDAVQKRIIFQHRRKIQLAKANAGKPNLSWIDAQIMLQTYHRRNLQQNTWTFFLSVVVMALGFGLIFFGINTAVKINIANSAINKVNIKAKTDSIVKAVSNLAKTTPANLTKAKTDSTVKVISALAKTDDSHPDKGEAGISRHPDDGTSLITILSTASGVIVNLIAGGFLALYNSTLKQAMDYTNSLQKTSTVGTSLAILESIDEIEGGQLDAETVAKIVDAKIAIAKQLIGTANPPS